MRALAGQTVVGRRACRRERILAAHPSAPSRSPVKIFFSSTFVDLSEVRKEISKWLAGLSEARLVVMETFGSDAAPPEVNSVRKVRGRAQGIDPAS